MGISCPQGTETFCVEWRDPNNEAPVGFLHSAFGLGRKDISGGIDFLSKFLSEGQRLSYRRLRSQCRDDLRAASPVDIGGMVAGILKFSPDNIAAFKLIIAAFQKALNRIRDL